MCIPVHIPCSGSNIYRYMPHAFTLIYSYFLLYHIFGKKNCCHAFESDPCRQSECVANGEDQKGSGIQLCQEDCASFKVRSIEFAGVDCVLLVEEVGTSSSCSMLMLAIGWNSVTSVNCSVQFEQLANIKFLCTPGRSAVEVVVSLSAVYRGEAFINLLCATGATYVQSSIKEQ